MAQHIGVGRISQRAMAPLVFNALPNPLGLLGKPYLAEIIAHISQVPRLSARTQQGQTWPSAYIWAEVQPA